MSRTARLPLLDPPSPAPLPLVEANPLCKSFMVNPYVACDLRCVYCITGAQGISEPRVPSVEVDAALREALLDVPPDALLVLGGFADAYPRVEEELGVTRAVLEELVRQRRPFRIVTKGAAVVRDVDLLSDEACRGVAVSLCSVDEDALARVDPGSPSAAERIDVVLRLREEGIDVSVAAMPWIPEVTDARALIASLPKHLRISFAPLNVLSPRVAPSPFGRRYRQSDVNEAYLADYRRVGRPYGVVWQPPVPLDGTPVSPFAGLP